MELHVYSPSADFVDGPYTLGLVPPQYRAERVRTLKLAGLTGNTLTYWLAGAWERGVTAPGVPAAKNWARQVEDLAARLLVPVKVEFKSK